MVHLQWYKLSEKDQPIAKIYLWADCKWQVITNTCCHWWHTYATVLLTLKHFGTLFKNWYCSRPMCHYNIGDMWKGMLYEMNVHNFCFSGCVNDFANPNLSWLVGHIRLNFIFYLWHSLMCILLVIPFWSYVYFFYNVTWFDKWLQKSHTGLSAPLSVA